MYVCVCVCVYIYIYIYIYISCCMNCSREELNYVRKNSIIFFLIVGQNLRCSKVHQATNFVSPSTIAHI